MPVAAVSVLATVTSQTRGFPPCHGIKVSPSGRLPSRLFMPEGSLVAGIPAALRARQMTSLSTGCLAILPGAFLHTMTDGLGRLRRTRTGICGDAQVETQSHANSHPHCFVLRYYYYLHMTYNVHKS